MLNHTKILSNESEMSVSEQIFEYSEIGGRYGSGKSLFYACVQWNRFLEAWPALF